MLSEHPVCRDPLHVCYRCGKKGCEECMSLVHFAEENEPDWADVWVHHWFKPNCLRTWFEEKGWLPK